MTLGMQEHTVTRAFPTAQPSASFRFSFEDRYHCLTAAADTLWWATFPKSFRQLRYLKACHLGLLLVVQQVNLYPRKRPSGV